MKACIAKLIPGLAVLFLVVAGCDDNSSPTDAGSEQDGDGFVAGDEGGDEGADEGADPGTDQDVEPVTAALPQAVADALFANPESYSEIPLRVATTGGAESVSVTLAENSYDGVDPDGDGVWVARLPIDSLDNDSYQVVATAHKTGADPATASAELVVATEGAQLTNYNVVGPAGTPRIHRRGQDVWLTWTDTPEDIRNVWLQRIDGAGRWIGERVALIADAIQTVHARTAFGNDSIGVLYQQPDGPWDIYFKIVDYDGNELLAPMDLVPVDLYGSFGGDILFDGQAYIMVWRVNYGDGGGGEVHWMRVEEDGQAVTGPIVVAVSGDEDPIGGFDPFSFVKVAAIGDGTLVTFVRKQHDYFLGENLPKSQVSRVMMDGSVEWTEITDSTSDMFEEWRFHRECRVFVIEGSYIIVWTRKDLNDEDPNAPDWFFGTTADADGNLDPDRGMGTQMADDPLNREEFVLVPHPYHFATMAWLDTRSYVDLLNGRIELLVAPLKDDLTIQDDVTFPHARFIIGVTQLVALPQDTNVLLVWLDERHGGGVLDPRPEVWFETAWY